MTDKEILKKVEYYANDSVHESTCCIGCGPHSSVSTSRNYWGGIYTVMERASYLVKNVNTLDEFKSAVNTWKDYNQSQYDANWSKPYYEDDRSMIERNNDGATYEGKVRGCNRLLNYIEKLEKE